MLSGMFGVIAFSWVASPAATELETIVMDWSVVLMRFVVNNTLWLTPPCTGLAEVLDFPTHSCPPEREEALFRAQRARRCGTTWSGMWISRIAHVLCAQTLVAVLAARERAISDAVARGEGTASTIAEKLTVYVRVVQFTTRCAHTGWHL